MTHRIGHITVISEEPDDICQECGKKDELRPYGKEGKRICYDCASNDPIESTIRMHKFMFGDDLTPEKAAEYLEKNPFIKSTKKS